MIQVSEEQFQELINQALAELPGEHVKNIQNVAILYEEVPTSDQRQKLALQNDQTLLGLYEGRESGERSRRTSGSDPPHLVARDRPLLRARSQKDPRFGVGLSFGFFSGFWSGRFGAIINGTALE
jgi:predicted Zn-dependent protease with MMP-like domain